MKICVFGAGAVGGLLAARLALAGLDVRAVARGAHLAAIRVDGLAGRAGSAGNRVMLAIPPMFSTTRFSAVLRRYA